MFILMFIRAPRAQRCRGAFWERIYVSNRAQVHGKRSCTVRNGRELEQRREPVSGSTHRSSVLTERIDLYLLAVVTLMFLGGCFLMGRECP